MLAIHDILKMLDTAMQLAERGDARRVDTLVGDIYGPEGAVDLNMPATVTGE